MYVLGSDIVQYGGLVPKICCLQLQVKVILPWNRSRYAITLGVHSVIKTCGLLDDERTQSTSFIHFARIWFEWICQRTERNKIWQELYNQKFYLLNSYSSHKTHHLNPPAATYTIWTSDIWRGVAMTRGAQHEQASPQPEWSPLGTVTRLLARVNPGSWPPGCVMETLARNVTWFYSDQFYRYNPPTPLTPQQLVGDSRLISPVEETNSVSNPL